MNASLDGTLHDALVEESAALSALEASDGHRGPMTRFLALGGQTREGERDPARFAEIVDGMLAETSPPARESAGE
jgi:hypothetical protein